MRSVVLVLASAVWAAMCGAALPCEGAKVIFEDRFEDDTGGWSDKTAAAIKDGSLVFSLPVDEMQSNLNVTFTVESADICADAVWPANGEQLILGAGLLFWGEDNRTYYQFGILNNGRFWIARKQDGAWMGTIAANIDSPAIKTSPGASNTLRVETQGDALAFYINGTKVRDLRGQAPSGRWRFGLSGDNFDKESEASVIFTKVKVTD